MDLILAKGERKSIRDLGLNEKWLQDQISNDPSILGLGDDLVIYKRESKPGHRRVVRQ